MTKSRQRYLCPTCGRSYISPVRLQDPPLCTGKSRKHSPKTMESR